MAGIQVRGRFEYYVPKTPDHQTFEQRTVEATATSDRRGEFRLEFSDDVTPASVRFEIASPVWMTRRWEQASTGRFKVWIVPAFRLAGTVVDGGGAPLAGVTIKHYAMVPLGAGSRMASEMVTRSDAGGRFASPEPVENARIVERQGHRQFHHRIVRVEKQQLAHFIQVVDKQLTHGRARHMQTGRVDEHQFADQMGPQQGEFHAGPTAEREAHDRHVFQFQLGQQIAIIEREQRLTRLDRFGHGHVNPRDEAGFGHADRDVLAERLDDAGRGHAHGVGLGRGFDGRRHLRRGRAHARGHDGGGADAGDGEIEGGFLE